MLRSLYSGITGMKVNQTKMDVIGNNIANVGTTAFKASRARFQDMLSQTAREAMAPAANQGGLNASQVGMGVQLAGVDTIVSQGMMQPTSRSLDVAVDGEGYFIVGKGPTVFDDGTLNVINDSTSNSNHYISAQNVMESMYTRDGSFTLDHDGNLLTSDGFRVLGYALTNGSQNGIKPNSVTLAGFNFDFSESSALNGYQIKIGTTNGNGVPTVNINKVDKIITLNDLDISTDLAATPPDAHVTTLTELTGAINNALSSNGITSQTVNVTGTIDAAAAVTGSVSNIITGGISPNESIEDNGDIDFVDATSQLGVVKNGTKNDALKTLRIPDVVYKADPETGVKIPVSVRSFTIDKDGLINAVLDTGEVAALGQIAMAGFKNPAGLTKLGKNLYKESVNSGIPTVKTGVGETTNSNAKGYGDILQGMLEMSNVDLAEQFTEMIVTSRAFQANGKVISTGDEILQDILNLKR